MEGTKKAARSEPQTWKVVLKIANIIRKQKQFPLCLSYAITRHKSQGFSLKNAVIDASNSIFTTGQIYVTLSRLNSLKWLYLINYDPSSVKANETAIIEYNRLRGLFRADLLTINVPSRRGQKIADRRWTVLREVAQCQQNREQHPTTKSEWSSNGFRNPDGISSYAYSAVQCLFHCKPIRERLLSEQDGKMMKNWINSYMQGSQNLNTFIIRHLAGQEYVFTKNQDVYEFLTALSSKCNYFRSVFLLNS